MKRRMATSFFYVNPVVQGATCYKKPLYEYYIKIGVYPSPCGGCKNITLSYIIFIREFCNMLQEFKDGSVILKTG